MSMESRAFLDCNFLEVSINSAKLSQMLQQIMKKIQHQEDKIESFHESMDTLNKSLLSVIDENKMSFTVELEKFAKLNQEQMHRNKLFLGEIDKSLDKKSSQIDKKIRQRENDIIRLYAKVHDLQLASETLQQNRLISQKKNSEDHEYFSKQIIELREDLEESSAKFERQAELVLIKVQSMLEQYNSDFKLGLPNRQSMFDKKMTPIMSAHIAQFSQKLDNMGKKIKEEKNPVLNNVFYSRNEEEKKSKIYIEKEDHQNSKADSIKQKIKKTLNKQEGKKRQISVQESKKLLQHLQGKFNEKIDGFYHDMDHFKNKLIVFDEKIGIQGRKIEKQHFGINELKVQIKKLQDKKTDDQLIEIVRNQLKKHIFQITEQLEKKVFKDSYERDKHKLNQRLSIIHENITDKADKGEIKKALLFLQEKIKQIILFIANEHIEDKDGAIKKIPIKCLSCDKGLQSSMTSPRKLVSPSATSRDKPRMYTAQFRRRHKNTYFDSCERSIREEGKKN